MAPLVVFGVMALLSGCAGWGPPTPDAGVPPLTVAARTMLVEDLVAGLKSSFPPAHTQLELPSTSLDGSRRPGDADARHDPHPDLTAHLAQALRAAGYGITYEHTDGVVGLRVHLHIPADNQLWVRLDAGPTYQWTRLYERQGTGLVPMSGPTVRVE